MTVSTTEVNNTVTITDDPDVITIVADNFTTRTNLTGHVTSVGNDTSLGSFTFAQLNTAVSDANLARTSGTNTFTGDQTFTNGVIARTVLAVGAASAADGQIQIFNESNALSVTITASNTTVENQDWHIPDAAGPTAVFVARDLAQSLTNKRITPRVAVIASSATPAINTDATDIASIGTLATNITSLTTSLTGTPSDGERLILRIKDTGSPRTITHGASFASRGATLLTTTTAGKWSYETFYWNSTTSTWDCVSAVTEA